MDKIAVLTGSTKGIGEATTHLLLKEGWEIYGISRAKKSPFSKNTLYHHLPFDLSQPVNLSDLLDILPPRIDLLINNAATWEVKAVADITLIHLEETFNLNFFTPALLTKLLLPRLPAGSLIINVSSIMSNLIDKGFAVYCASKASLDRLTTTLAKEQPQLRVVGILPASTDTPQGREKALPTDDPKTMLTSPEVAALIMETVNGKFASGQLVVIVNREMSDWWEGRDNYTLINVDQTST